MSRYGTPFCSDEELLEELNKLGYDEVSSDVFSMMKDDLVDLVEKDKDNFPLSEYDYNDASPVSSKFLSASSDALLENRFKQENDQKTDSSKSRKVKKKSQNKNSRAINDKDFDQHELESNRWKNAARKQKVNSSSNPSLNYDNMYNIADEDILEETDMAYRRVDDMDGSKSNNNHLIRQHSETDVNKNEDIKYANISKTYKSKERDFPMGYSSKNDRFAEDDIPATKYKSNTSRDNKHASSPRKTQNSPYSLSSSKTSAPDNSMKAVEDAFKAFRIDKNSDESLHDYKGSNFNLNSSGSSTGSETKTIKRKVLRRRNGRSVITEELIQIPNVLFDTSYPESENLNSSKSFSSDDLSCKSNCSTGSVTAASPESIKSSPSTLSLLSTRSTSFRVPRKKKSDPVAMYNYYKKFWNDFKPPGENTHDRLRWTVRDKMLEYHI